MTVLSDAIRAKIVDACGRYPNKQAVTLPALHWVQQEQGSDRRDRRSSGSFGGAGHRHDDVLWIFQRRKASAWSTKDLGLPVS
jgi:hypothetical protein